MDEVYRQMLGMALMAIMVLVVVGLGTYLAYLTGEKVTSRTESRADEAGDDDGRREPAAGTAATARD